MSQETPPLDAQLDSYYAASQLRAGKRDFSDWTRRWPVYAAAAGSALAFTTSAQADIIYSGLLNTTATIAPDPRLPDFPALSYGKVTVPNVLGLFAFQSSNHGARSGKAFLSSAGSGPHMRFLDTGGDFAKPLASGAKISGGAAGFFYEFGLVAVHTGTYAAGNLASGQVGFVGLALNDNGPN